MKTLHRYIAKTFIGPFIMVFAVVVFIFLMQFLWKYIDDLVGKDLDLVVICKLLFYASAGLSSMAFPLAVLLASIMTMGSLGENYELIAMKASGISLQRIMKPLVVVSALIGVAAFLCANYLTPYTNFKFRTLLYSIQQKRPELQIREGVFFDSIDGYSIRIGHRNYNNNMLYDIQIYDHTAAAGNVSLTMADSGFMTMTENKRYMELVLYDAEAYNDVLDSRGRIQQTRPFRRDFYAVQTIRIPLGDFSLQEIDENLFKQGYQMMNVRQLNYVIDSLQTELSANYEELVTLVKPRFNRSQNEQIYRDTVLADVPAYLASQSKYLRLRSVRNAMDAVRAIKNDAATSQIVTASSFRDVRRYAIELQRKFSMAFACFIFFFIGAPLGSVIRKGGMGAAIVVAVLFFVFYYVINIIGEKSAREGLLTPAEGMWIASAVLLPIGVFLTAQATRDASMLTADLYRTFFKKVLAVLFPVQHAALPFAGPFGQVTPEATRRAIDDFDRQALAALARMHTWPHYYEMWHSGRADAAPDALRRAELAGLYSRMRGMLDAIRLDVSSMKYTAYPDLSFELPRLNTSSWGLPLLTLVVFPVGLYLYLRMHVSQCRFKAQLLEATRVNRIVRQAVEEMEWDA